MTVLYMFLCKIWLTKLFITKGANSIVVIFFLLPFFLEIPKETLDTVYTNSIGKICKNNENSGDSFYDATNLLCTAGTQLEYPNTY